jgi:hypothetical protein
MDNLIGLSQFISYYESQGVSNFSFYDLGLSARVRDYLRKLGSESNILSISLSPWNLPTGNWTELWDYGSLSALNDCLYRNMREKTLVIVADIDEFMVPQGRSIGSRTGSLKDILFSRKLSKYSQFLIRNTFFCKEFCEPMPTTLPQPIPVLSCTNRTKRIWNVKLRSKYVVRPLDLLQVGHHTTTKFLRGDPRLSQSFEFPTSKMILNHYRECGSISTSSQPILNRVVIQDESMLKYAWKLMGTNAHRLLMRMMEHGM